jgi:hypothetical protein
MDVQVLVANVMQYHSINIVPVFRIFLRMVVFYTNNCYDLTPLWETAKLSVPCAGKKTDKR